jgi:myosin heavy subunit
VRDELLERGAQTVEGGSAVDQVRATLLKRDEALLKTREDLAAMRTVAEEWETKLASTGAQLQQDRATLEGAWSWQSQAEEKAKEAEQLRVELAEKATTLATAEEQLQQEHSTRQQVEARLQQERSALEEARAALERERVALEEAYGQLQRERAALEEARATLKLRDGEIPRLDGELNQLSASHENLRQTVEEQEATILALQKAAETAHTALETEKKQVEGESPLSAFRLLARFVWDPLSFFVSRFWFSGLRTAFGNSATQAQAVQMACNSSQQELEELRAAALEACQAVEEGEVQVGSSMASCLCALSRHITQCMRRALHLGVQKALGVVVSHYQVDLEAVSTGYVVPVGVDDEVAMNRADALAAPAANVLAEDFTNFLFPDAPLVGGPEA